MIYWYNKEPLWNWFEPTANANVIIIDLFKMYYCISVLFSSKGSFNSHQMQINLYILEINYTVGDVS